MDFELRFFQDFVSRREGSNTLAFERTRRWFLGAAAAQSTPASADPRVISPSSTVDIVQSAVCSGVLDLVFHPSSFATSPLSTALAQLPETFQLDSYRLASFQSDATDLTIVYLLLSLFRQLCYPARASEAEVDEMRRDIWAIMAGANSAGEKVQVGVTAAAAGQAASSGMAKLECASWREGMKDVGLQIATRATRIKADLPSFSTTSLPLIPSASTLALVDSYFNSHLRASSKVFQLLQARLQSTLGVILAEELADEANAQWWTTNVASPACSGSASMMSGGGRRGGCSVRSTPLVADAGSMAAAVGGGGGARGKKRSLGEGECGDEEGSSSDEEGEKRARTARTSLTSRTRSTVEPTAIHSSTTTSHSLVDATLARNGLTSLSTEVRLLGERVGRVTSFHLAVYKEYYRSLLSSSTL